MIDVLIVDDEPKLREGLKSIVPWNELGYRVADTAANGQEALEKHRLHRPALMLVDIRMPGMDGLALIEAVRAVDSRIHLLILSGYAEFDYARKAISQRVDGYLLKPVDEAELAGHLVAIKEAIEQEWLRDVGRKAAEVTRELLIQSLLAEEAAIDAAMLEQAARLGLNWERYQVLLIDVLGQESPDGPAAADGRLKRALGEAVEEQGGGAVFTYRSYVGMLLPQPLRTGFACAAMYRLIEKAAKQAGTAFRAAAGEPVRRLEDIALSCRTAEDLLRSRFFYPEAELLSSFSVRFASDAAHAAEEEQSYCAERYMRQLYYAVDTASKEAQRKLIRSAACAMARDGYTEERMKQAFAELLAAIYHKLALHDAELGARATHYSDRLAAIYRQRTAEQLCRHCAYCLEELSPAAGKGGHDQDMKRIVELIHRNYSDNLKLETLASVFNYSSAYLGKMFKNATGEYFNTYLDKVRISKAKQLLKQGMKVYQVAEKVGYANVDYFHSKFKKYVGTSPSHYRKEPQP